MATIHFKILHLVTIKQMTYSEKLKDPRWQKKRLEVMQRDGFKCTYCSNDQITLHVHHKKYGANPWDIHIKHLETVCKYCHEIIEEFKKEEDDVLDIKFAHHYGEHDIYVVKSRNQFNDEYFTMIDNIDGVLKRSNLSICKETVFIMINMP